MTTTAAATARIASGVVRVRSSQLFNWTSDYQWRQGPSTDDGFWMVERIYYGRPPTAVRCILDEAAPERTSGALRRALEDATKAAEFDAQDGYLSAISIAAAMQPDDLIRLRDAVASGRAGGSADGGPPRKRARKSVSQ